MMHYGLPTCECVIFGKEIWFATVVYRMFRRPTSRVLVSRYCEPWAVSLIVEIV